MHKYQKACYLLHCQGPFQIHLLIQTWTTIAFFPPPPPRIAVGSMNELADMMKASSSQLSMQCHQSTTLIDHCIFWEVIFIALVILRLELQTKTIPELQKSKRPNPLFTVPSLLLLHLLCIQVNGREQN